MNGGGFVHEIGSYCADQGFSLRNDRIRFREDSLNDNLIYITDYIDYM